MPSTGFQSAPVENHNQPGWSNGYGLRSWMRSSIDRLNMATNLDEYACSPPETDSGFILDFDTKVTTPLAGEQHPIVHQAVSLLKTSHSAPTLCELERSTQEHELSKALKEATKQSFLANSAALAVPHILGCHSASTSTETTPSTTPQGSPFNVRKNIHKTHDDPISPGSGKKWFYTGMLSEKGAETMPVLRENPDSAAPVTVSKRGRPNKVALATKGLKKYMVSNFDLNAVSPTSW